MWFILSLFWCVSLAGRVSATFRCLTPATCFAEKSSRLGNSFLPMFRDSRPPRVEKTPRLINSLISYTKKKCMQLQCCGRNTSIDHTLQVIWGEIMDKLLFIFKDFRKTWETNASFPSIRKYVAIDDFESKYIVPIQWRVNEKWRKSYLLTKLFIWNKKTWLLWDSRFPCSQYIFYGLKGFL